MRYVRLALALLALVLLVMVCGCGGLNGRYTRIEPRPDAPGYDLHKDGTFLTHGTPPRECEGKYTANGTTVTLQENPDTDRDPNNWAPLVGTMRRALVMFNNYSMESGAASEATLRCSGGDFVGPHAPEDRAPSGTFVCHGPFHDGEAFNLDPGGTFTGPEGIRGNWEYTNLPGDVTFVFPPRTYTGQIAEDGLVIGSDKYELVVYPQGLMSEGERQYRSTIGGTEVAYEFKRDGTFVSPAGLEGKYDISGDRITFHQLLFGTTGVTTGTIKGDAVTVDGATYRKAKPGAPPKVPTGTR